MEGLICAIASQENQDRANKAISEGRNNTFDNNLKFYQELQDKDLQKPIHSNFKTMSNLQYENQINKVAEVLTQIRQLQQKTVTILLFRMSSMKSPTNQSLPNLSSERM